MKIMNKKRIALTSLLFFFIALGITATWTEKSFSGKPFGPENPASLANIIIVAKSAGGFDSIQAAIDSIDSASETKSYIIRVMPGIYNESITMKSYIDLVGSGIENTKITSDYWTTVIGASNSMLENIWLENNNAGEARSVIYNDNVTTTINKVKITFNITDSTAGETSAIENKGSNVIISNSSIEVKGGQNSDCIGISVRSGSKVFISNSDIEVDTTGGTYSFWNVGVLSSGGSNNVSIRDSVIRTAGADYNYGIETGSGEMTVSNSRIEAIGTYPNTRENYAVHRRNLTVTNSELIVSGTATSHCAVYGSSSIKVGGSLIQGNICKTPKIVDSWDGNFNPIPSQ